MRPQERRVYFDTKGQGGEHTLRIPVTSRQLYRLRQAAYSFGWPVARWARLALTEAAEDAITLDECGRRGHQ
jgi:hypothetical protein